MHTQSNPQQPAITGTPAESPKVPTTAREGSDQPSGGCTPDGLASITRSTNKGLEPHLDWSNGERSRIASGAHQSRRPGDAPTPRARQRRDRKEVFDAH